MEERTFTPETLISIQDWKRIKVYSDAQLKRHTKLIVFAMNTKSNVFFGSQTIQKLNFN